MKPIQKAVWIKAGSLLMGASIAASAFFAHQKIFALTHQDLKRIETANHTLVVNGLMLIVFGILQHFYVISKGIGTCLLTGTLIFYASLISLSLFQIQKVAHIAPIGGIMIIVSYFLLAIRLKEVK